MAERKNFMTALIDHIGSREVCDLYIPRGGDLFVVPLDLNQQKALLNLDKATVANRLISCSLPNSVAALHKGIIFDVPKSDSEADILSALTDQNVVAVQRAFDKEKNPLSFVYLSFSSQSPPYIKMTRVRYEVSRYYPNPCRCKNCWRLRHMTTHCNSSPLC